MQKTHYYQHTSRVKISGLLLGLLLAWSPSVYAERLPIKTYTTADGLPRDSVRRILQDSRGFLWFSTSEGLSRFDGYQFTNYGTEQGLPHPMVNYVLETRGGTYWVATNGGGVCRFNTGGAATITSSHRVRANESKDSATRREPTFVVYRIGPGAAQAVNVLLEDHTGVLWCGTDGGLYRLEALGGGWISRYVDIGLPAKEGGFMPVGALLEDRSGSLWVGAESGLYRRWPDGRTEHYTTEHGLLGWGWRQVTFQDHTGEWWVPTGQGLCRFPKVPRLEDLAHTPPMAVYTSQNGMPGNEVFRLFEDARGDIWISTDKLTRWERATQTFHAYTETEGVTHFLATAYCEDRAGHLWMGFYGGGVARYRDGRFTFFTAADGLPAGQIQDLYTDHAGRLWIGIAAPGGLVRVDDPGAARLHFMIYTTAHGLSSDTIRCITEDSWGRIYVGTGRGVDRLDPTTGHIRHYSTAEGLANNYVQMAFRDRQGVLWFGTLQGVSQLIPEPDRPSPPVSVLIRGLRIAGALSPLSELGETEISGLVLNPDQNSVQIEFVALTFEPGQRLRYQYKLEGVDQDWSTPSGQRTVNLAIGLPGMSGLEGIRQLKARYPRLLMLMLTVYDDDDRIFEALCAGACGYLLKKTPPARLLESIREVMSGGAPMSPEVARRVIALFRQVRPPERAEYALTPHETRLLKMLVEGHNYKTMADELAVSVNTISFHMRNIYDKLQVHSKSEAVAKALRHRLVE